MSCEHQDHEDCMNCTICGNCDESLNDEDICSSCLEAPKIDTVGLIMEFEQGTLDDDGIIELFQELINNGTAWTLQGSYGRMATQLIEAGYCDVKA